MQPLAKMSKAIAMTRMMMGPTAKAMGGRFVCFESFAIRSIFERALLAWSSFCYNWSIYIFYII